MLHGVERGNKYKNQICMQDFDPLTTINLSIRQSIEVSSRERIVLLVSSRYVTLDTLACIIIVNIHLSSA
jgi:hypothetical protein